LTCHIQLPYHIQFHPKGDQANYISGTVQNDTVVMCLQLDLGVFVDTFRSKLYILSTHCHTPCNTYLQVICVETAGVVME